MKKIILVVAFFIFVMAFPMDSNCTSKWDWHIIIDGGETHGIFSFTWFGFKKVDSNPNTKTLQCTGRGVNECAIYGAENDCLGSQTNEMIDYAVTKYMNGVLTGSYNKIILCENEEIHYNCTVTWSNDPDTGVCDIYTINQIVR